MLGIRSRPQLKRQNCHTNCQAKRSPDFKQNIAKFDVGFNDSPVRTGVVGLQLGTHFGQAEARTHKGASLLCFIDITACRKRLGWIFSRRFHLSSLVFGGWVFLVKGTRDFRNFGASETWLFSLFTLRPFIVLLYCHMYPAKSLQFGPFPLYLAKFRTDVQVF